MAANLYVHLEFWMFVSLQDMWLTYTWIALHAGIYGTYAQQ